MNLQLTRAEKHAVDAHRLHLSAERGSDVSFEDALIDWNDRCAVHWRETRQQEILAAQRAEIERHKWIESEKAGHDLGRDAVMDWIKNNAAAWRQWYESREEAAI